MKSILCFSLFLALASCQAQSTQTMKEPEQYAVQKSEQEWKSVLTEKQYNVLRQAGTERPFTGEYNLHFEEGMYHCAGCNAPLFDSESKFDSHCGWPSFDKALNKKTVVEILDTSHGMIRTEIRCATCGGHLGHVFPDGPTETGMRYCINSAALKFEGEK